MARVKVPATTARKARSKVANSFPQGAVLYGFDDAGECVYMNKVRPRGRKSAKRDGALCAYFEAEPAEVVNVAE